MNNKLINYPKKKHLYEYNIFYRKKSRKKIGISIPGSGSK